jgi:hypothetical protein
MSKVSNLSQFCARLTVLVVAITPSLTLAAPTRHGTEQVVDPQPELTLPSSPRAPLIPHPTPIPPPRPVDPGHANACIPAALGLMALINNDPRELADYAQAAAAAASPTWGHREYRLIGLIVFPELAVCH